MQLVNLICRIGGSLLHTVPVLNATPAEILILKRIHGDDAVVDVVPIKEAKIGQEAEWDRLSAKYDAASSMSAPGDDSRSIMSALFPGAMRKLPIRLADIGLGHLTSPAARAAAAAAAALVAQSDSDQAPPRSPTLDPVEDEGDGDETQQGDD